MSTQRTTRSKAEYIVGAVLALLMVIGLYLFFTNKLLAEESSTKKTFEQLRQECIDKYKADTSKGIVYKQYPCSDRLIRNEYLEQ